MQISKAPHLEDPILEAMSRTFSFQQLVIATTTAPTATTAATPPPPPHFCASSLSFLSLLSFYENRIYMYTYYILIIIIASSTVSAAESCFPICDAAGHELPTASRGDPGGSSDTSGVRMTDSFALVQYHDFGKIARFLSLLDTCTRNGLLDGRMMMSDTNTTN